MSNEQLKQQVAQMALSYIEYGAVLGVGTGSTVNYLIDALATVKGKIEGAVSSSEQTTQRLQQLGIPVLDLNSVSRLPVYIDGADEVNPHQQLLKGGGAALTREKIVASVAKQFVCLIDPSKRVDVLGQFPLPIEVIPMARSYVAREIVKLGGRPEYRQGVVTDNNNVIIDVYGLQILDPITLEKRINNITGVVCNGIFAQRPADVVLCAE